jgi:hypothetical protein
VTQVPVDRLHDLNDPALWPLLDAIDERSRESAVEALLAHDVKPVIATVLKRFRRLEPTLQIEDFEEIQSRVVLRFLRKLRAALVQEERAIGALENYVATLTYNAVYDDRRQRYPERHRLKRTLRYLLTRDPAFALWEVADDFVAGLASWRNHAPRSLTGTLNAGSATPAMLDRDHARDALYEILQRIGHPVAFDALVTLVADLWGVRDVILEQDTVPADEQLDALATLEQREYVETLWSEVLELPKGQRAALLLNLRDASGGNALVLFLLLNVANATELAQAVGLTETELNALWESLPLDDLTIAERMNLTRQQVINLRKSARLRLARRMTKWK